MKINYFILLCFFLLKTEFLLAQSPYIWQDKKSDEIKNFEILLDKNYAFNQILSDSTLLFQENPKHYKFEKENYCWFRFSIQNKSIYTKEGYIRLIPHLKNTLYYYDYENKKWKSIQAGIAINDFNREEGIFPILLQAKHTNTFYIKSEVKELHSQSYPTQLDLYIYSKAAFDKNESFVIFSAIIVCFAMLLFIFYNLYIYLFLKDKTYLYYIIMIFSGILYIIFLTDIPHLSLPFNFYNIQIQPNGFLYFYSINTIVLVFVIWLLLFGYIQFTRTYLQLSIYFKSWDKILNYALLLFSVYSLFFVVISCFTSLFIYVQLASISNLFVGVTILLIISVAIRSYLQGHKLGRYFLFANLLPLVIIFIIAIYFLVYQYNIRPIQLLPHIALVTQTVTFAIALVARINLLKDQLKEKQLEAHTLQRENEKIIARNRYIELENEYIMADVITAVNKELDLQEKMKVEINQKAELEQKIQFEINQKMELKAKLEANQRELTANALYLYQKNEMLANLQKQIQNLSFKDTTPQNREGLREIKSTIKNDLYLENDWEKFKIHFEEVHPSFFKELKEKYPTLTPNEIRLSAYYHLNMTAKEIATLLNINPTSVHRAKSRLNKKMEELDRKNKQ